MAKPTFTKPVELPPEALSKVPEDVMLPKLPDTPPVDTGLPADLPMIPVEVQDRFSDFAEWPGQADPDPFQFLDDIL